MNSIPFDVIHHVLIKFLPISDLVSVGLVCREYSTLLHENELWIFLIKRDFHYQFAFQDAKEEYKYAKEIHDSSSIPVTKVEMVMKKYGYKSWKKLIEFLEKTGFTLKGDAFILDNYPVEKAYARMEQCLDFAPGYRKTVWTLPWEVFGKPRDKNKDFQNAQKAIPELLPRIFHGVTLEIVKIAEIYDFYNHQGAFWNGFMPIAQRILDRCHSSREETEILLVLNEMKKLYSP